MNGMKGKQIKQIKTKNKKTKNKKQNKKRKEKKERKTRVRKNRAPAVRVKPEPRFSGQKNRVETEPRFSGQKEARAKTNRGPSQTRKSVKKETLKRTAVSKYPGSTYLSDPPWSDSTKNILS